VARSTTAAVVARCGRTLNNTAARWLAAATRASSPAACSIWAEGGKRRNTVCLTNSDADLVDVFLRFLREWYSVTDDRVTLSVNCFLQNSLTLGEIEHWWLDRLELPGFCLRAAAVNSLSSASKRRKGHILPYGTARLTVHSTFIVQSIYGAIQEYAGIERPEWLDL
jgi:hypothetical protein